MSLAKPYMSICYQQSGLWRINSYRVSGRAAEPLGCGFRVPASKFVEFHYGFPLLVREMSYKFLPKLLWGPPGPRITILRVVFRISSGIDMHFMLPQGFPNHHDYVDVSNCL